MRPHVAAMDETLGAGGTPVQMLSRLGYGPVVPPSPRWPAANRIVAG